VIATKSVKSEFGAAFESLFGTKVRDPNRADDCRSMSMNQPLTYALGYSESEFKRLESQGVFFRDLTEDVLCRAGVVSGMRVLDVGCGVGDVSLLAGERGAQANPKASHTASTGLAGRSSGLSSSSLGPIPDAAIRRIS
jgi:hypothetical protein